MMNTQLIAWLYEHAGPIIRWRLIRDFDMFDAIDTEKKSFGSTGSQMITFLAGVKRFRFVLVLCDPCQEGCTLTDVNHSSTERSRSIRPQRAKDISS